MSFSAAEPSRASLAAGGSRLQTALEIALVLVIFAVQAGWPPPDLNETHYLGKAKHYWQPEWAAGDFFFGTRDAHVVFFCSCGWLTQWLPLEAVAWVGRAVTWLLLAWSWQRMSAALVPRRWFAVLSGALLAMLTARMHMAGEWILGGLEAKGFAFAAVLTALRLFVEGRWLATWLMLGAATALHVLVGGWATVAVTIGWLISGRGLPRGRLLVAGPLLGGAIGLLGLVPAVSLSWGVDPAVVDQANVVYVYRRLAHHLDLRSIEPLHIARHVALLIAWIGLCALRPDARLRPLRAFVAGAVMIAVTGAVVNLTTPVDSVSAAAVLRFYWYRLSDVMLPAGVAIELAALTTSLVNRRPRWGSAVTVALVLVAAAHLWPYAERRVQPRGPRGVRMPHAADWIAACRWAREQTPSDARFITPRTSQSFTWYAGRGEVVNWKNIPQDAESIVVWWRRLGGLWREDDPLTRRHWYDQPGELPLERLLAAAARYDAQYVLAAREPPLALPVVYQNNSYRIYRVPE